MRIDGERESSTGMSPREKVFNYVTLTLTLNFKTRVCNIFVQVLVQIPAEVEA